MDKDELIRHIDILSNDDLKIEYLQGILKKNENIKVVLGKNDPIVILDEKYKFYWDRYDPRTAISCLVVQGYYEKYETKILSYFAETKNGSIIDIGANLGYYSVILGKLLKSSDKLIAFEANPQIIEMLNKNIDLNDLQDYVKVINCALSDISDQKLKLYIPLKAGSSAASLNKLHPDDSNNSIEIITQRLDDLTQIRDLESVSLIKIDVEGAELSVIKGALETIRENKPVLFIELLRKWSKIFGYHPNDVLIILQDLGYKVFEVNGELKNIERIDESTVSTNFLLLPDTADAQKDLYNLRSLLASR
jgi:FkbM family methyltransferase